jgi:hypothetical protein
MLRSFITWLDNYLAGEGPSAVVKAAIGFMSFAAVLGAILGSTAIRTGALVVVIFVILALMLILLADRRRIQWEADEHRRLLTLYCDFIIDRPKPAIRVLKWEQVVFIEPNGDSRETIMIHGIVLRDKLYFLALKASSRWEQPDWYRSKVKVKARSLTVDGARGTSWALTSSWRSDGQMDLLAHLHQPATYGSEIRLEIERYWPGKCIPLMVKNHPDEFTLRFTELMPMEDATYEVVLPSGVDAYYEPIGFTQPNGNYSIKSDRKQGRCTFVFVAKSMPPNQSIGIRLEIK